MDAAKTYMNSITAKTPEGSRVALTADTDRQALDVAIACCVQVRAASARIVRMVDTKHLEWLLASEALLARARGDRQVRGRPARGPDRLRRRRAVHRLAARVTAHAGAGRPPGLARVSDRLAGLSPARRGALIFVVSGLVFVTADSMIKSLVASVPVVDVVLGRNVVALVAIVAHRGTAARPDGSSGRRGRGRSSPAAWRCSPPRPPTSSRCPCCPSPRSAPCPRPRR